MEKGQLELGKLLLRHRDPCKVVERNDEASATLNTKGDTPPER
jgi:hypothetical protein